METVWSGCCVTAAWSGCMKKSLLTAATWCANYNQCHSCMSLAVKNDWFTVFKSFYCLHTTHLQHSEYILLVNVIWRGAKCWYWRFKWNVLWYRIWVIFPKGGEETWFAAQNVILPLDPTKQDTQLTPDHGSCRLHCWTTAIANTNLSTWLRLECSEMKDIFLLLHYIWSRSLTSFLSLWLSLRSYSDRENHRHLLGLNNVLDSNNTQRSRRV